MPKSGKAEISVYIHLPFCRRKCPYCHFYVLPNDEKLKQKLMSALAREWELHREKIAGKKIVSLYFGGGTPSLMPVEAIATLVKMVSPPAGCEITLEANPEDVTWELARAWKESGVNRLSMGVQSLDDTSLTILERTHSAKRSCDAVEAAFGAGITNISIDLMYDLPEQTLESFQRTLTRVQQLPISHLSLYNLTIEPHTSFFKRRKELAPALPAPDTSLKLLELACTELPRMGLTRYEISAFAKEGCASLHNTGYWTARPFLGLGPSAFSYFEKKRFRNCAHLSRYAEALALGNSPVDFEETLPYPDNLHELLAVELRLLRGVDLAHFEQRHGPLPPSTHATLAHLQAKGFLERTPTHLQLSPQGLLFYDSVATDLI